MAKADNFYGKVVMPKNREKRKQLFTFKKREKILEVIFIFAASYLMGHINFFNALNPVGIAFCGACMGMEGIFYMSAFGCFIGYVTGSRFFGFYGYAVSLAIMAVFVFWQEGKKHKLTERKKAVISSVSLLLGGLTVSALNEMSIFLAVRAVVESMAVGALCVFLGRGIKTAESKISRRVLTEDEALSIFVPFIFIIASLSGSEIFGVSLKMFLSVFFMLSVSYVFGAAAGGSAGCILGFVLIMCGVCDYTFLCVMSFGGIMCGFFGRNNKTAALLSFAVSSVVPAFYMGMEQDRAGAVMSVLGALLFLAVPQRFFDGISTYSSGKKEFDENKYFIRIREYTEKKLSNLAKSFKALSDIFGGNKYEENMLFSSGTAKIADAAAERVCSGCGLGIYCWKAKNAETYAAVYSMISDFEENGKVDIKKIPSAFGKSCVKLKSLAEAVNSCCREFQTARIWKNRIDESRNIICRQLLSLSKIVKETAENTNFRPVFDESAEKEICRRLEKDGIFIENVSVRTGKNEDVYVMIESNDCGGKERCSCLFKQEISSVLGRTMVLKSKNCSGKNCISTFEEEPVFGCSFVHCMAVCGGGEVSGDSFEAKKYGSYNFTAAISDGMGTGEKAARQSRKTIEKFNSLMEADFDAETAVKAVNCSLTGEFDESFATLDVLTIDLKSGKGKIIKNGGSSVFIIRNGNVTAVRSTSLPLGISCSSQSDITSFSLENKDIVLMVTDGITDGVKWENEENEIKKVLADSTDIKKLCAGIIENAVKRDGGTPKDDMLALAVKVYES